MADLVVNGATLSCTQGSASSSLTVTAQTEGGEDNGIANINDAIPSTNISPFGTCTILTAAASGVSTSCVPATVAWAPGATTVTVRGMPAVNDSCTLICSIGGTISVDDPGTTKESCE